MSELFEENVGVSQGCVIYHGCIMSVDGKLCEMKQVGCTAGPNCNF